MGLGLFGSGSGDQFMVNDDKIKPGETPKDDMIFHSFTYVPDKLACIHQTKLNTNGINITL